MLHETIVVCIKARYLYFILPAWTALWCLIGFSVGKWLQRPKQYIVVDDNGACPAKLALNELQEQRASGEPVR